MKGLWKHPRYCSYYQNSFSLGTLSFYLALWRPVENKHQQENQKAQYAIGNRESFVSVILRGRKRCVEWKKQKVAWKHITANLVASDVYQLSSAPQRIKHEICFYHSGSAVLWLRICFMWGKKTYKLINRCIWFEWPQSKKRFLQQSPCLWVFRKWV